MNKNEFEWFLCEWRKPLVKNILEFYRDSTFLDMSSEDKDYYESINHKAINTKGGVLRCWVWSEIDKHKNINWQDVEEMINELIDFNCIKELNLFLDTPEGHVKMNPTSTQGYGKLTDKGIKLLKEITNA